MLWELVAGIGFLVCLSMFVDALRDYRALRRDGRNGALILIATAALRGDGIRVAIAFLWLLAGVSAMDSRWSGWPWLLLASAGLFTVNAILSRVHRRTLTAYLDEHGEPPRGGL